MAGARQDVVRGFPRARKFSMPRTEKSAMLIRRRREWVLIYCEVILNMTAERGVATVVAEREARVGERWYVSCFQRG
jgi:hypothetical protein